MFAIVIAFASLVIALPSAAQDLADVIEKCERSVVRIEGKKRGQVCSVEKALFRFVVFCNYAA